MAREGVTESLQGCPGRLGAQGLGWGGSQGWGLSAAFPLSPQSQNKAKQCKDSAMEAGTWLAHLLSLGGGVAWTFLPPQHTSFTLATVTLITLISKLMQVKQKHSFSHICQDCSWCFACFN